MNKRIVTIGREYGSGGRIVGQKLAEDMGVPFYDKALLDRIAEESGFSKELVEKAELKAKNSFIYTLATSLGGNGEAGIEGLSLNDRFFLAQVEVIRKIVEEGPCVIVGRCADYVLKDQPQVTNFFICADMKERIKRSVSDYGLSEKNAEHEIQKIDKARANYYTYHTGQKWGNITNYHMTINSGSIDLADIVKLMEEYLELRTF